MATIKDDYLLFLRDQQEKLTFFTALFCRDMEKEIRDRLMAKNEYGGSIRAHIYVELVKQLQKRLVGSNESGDYWKSNLEYYLSDDYETLFKAKIN